MMSCYLLTLTVAHSQQSSVSDGDGEECYAILSENSSSTARIRAAAAAVAEEERSSFGVAGVQDSPPVSSLREEDSDPEINTRNCHTAQDIRVGAAAAKKRALFGSVTLQNLPPVSLLRLREEDPDLEINTRNYIVGLSGFQRALPQG